MLSANLRQTTREGSFAIPNPARGTKLEASPSRTVRDTWRSTKESVMNLKSQVSNMTSKLSEQRGELSDRADEVRRTVEDWGDRSRTFVRENPGIALLGAFAVGFLLAKAARHA
jgi:ElaB/YqjD/DUF883 family membrane-anchored ribosome-binding protein